MHLSIGPWRFHVKLAKIASFTVDLYGGQMASTLRNLSSMCRKCLLGEVFVPFGQQNPEILSSLHFVPYWGLASINMPRCQNPWKPLKCASTVLSWQNIEASQSTGSWVIERPPFYNVLSISQRPINFLRLFLHRWCTFLLAFWVLVPFWPQMAILRIGLHGGRTASILRNM